MLSKDTIILLNDFKDLAEGYRFGLLSDQEVMRELHRLAFRLDIEMAEAAGFGKAEKETKHRPNLTEDQRRAVKIMTDALKKYVRQKNN